MCYPRPGQLPANRLHHSLLLPLVLVDVQAQVRASPPSNLEAEKSRLEVVELARVELDGLGHLAGGGVHEPHSAWGLDPRGQGGDRRSGKP